MTPKFLKLAKSILVQGKKKWIEVSPEDSKQHDYFPKNMEKRAFINYRQGEGKQICLVASFASFIHSVGC